MEIKEIEKIVNENDNNPSNVPLTFELEMVLGVNTTTFLCSHDDNLTEKEYIIEEYGEDLVLINDDITPIKEIYFSEQKYDRYNATVFTDIDNNIWGILYGQD
jgi:hypothetical protein